METSFGFHPGGEDLTREAARAAGWKAGDRILDVGCGDGASMRLLRDELGVKPVGCDRDKAILARAKELDSSLQLRQTDGLCLDFPSLYFDGALLECSFSLMNRHDELLHELYCVLKPGASIAITDLYCINPDADRAGEVYYEAKRILNTPRKEDDCKTADSLPSPYLLDGMFVIDNLLHAIRETGFEITLFRDRTKQLQDYYAQLLFDYGSLDAYWEQVLPKGCKPFCRAVPGKNCGYFLLTAQKETK
ncbi:MAG: methyltransferase domain-containing protein [Oscillospiraceae bacterium]|nr:methyltransferase domain-containing protein [Oscillospiraceae bacterium]